MGFKWFKARMRMNRMPAQSSAIEGSYRTSSMFDSPHNEFTTNYNYTGSNGHINPASKLNIRPVSMPILNNPMAGIDNGAKIPEFVSTSNNKTTSKSSTEIRDGLVSDEEDDYDTLGIRNPVLSSSGTFQQNFNENIARTTPRPSPKINKIDYKKKKIKAAAPKLRLNISSGTASENGSGEFITLQNTKKTSEDSDVDV